jgi:hypothetical protein
MLWGIEVDRVHQARAKGHLLPVLPGVGGWKGGDSNEEARGRGVGSRGAGATTGEWAAAETGAAVGWGGGG